MKLSKTVQLFSLIITLIGLSPALANAAGEPVQSPSWMFVQEAASGTLVGPDNQHLILTLKKVRDYTASFTDRPFRDAVDILDQTFFDNWESGFSGDPPNATLSYRIPGESRPRSIVLELTAPIYDSRKKTITYNAALIHERHRNFDASIPDRSIKIPSHFNSPSLFIDGIFDSWWCVLTHVGNPEACE